MQTRFINIENSKTSELNSYFLNLTDKVNIKRYE